MLPEPPARLKIVCGQPIKSQDGNYVSLADYDKLLSFAVRLQLLYNRQKRETADARLRLVKEERRSEALSTQLGLSVQSEVRALRKALEAAAIAAKGRAVVEDFMPNVGNCVLQDFARLNEFLLESGTLGQETGHG